MLIEISNDEIIALAFTGTTASLYGAQLDSDPATFDVADALYDVVGVALDFVRRAQEAANVG